MPRLSDEDEDEDENENDVSLDPVDPTASTIHGPVDVDANGYVHSWSWIASRERVRSSYVCQVCGISLRQRVRLLHVHHLDREKNNNDPRNLQVRCALCHSKADGHSHLLGHISADDYTFIETLQLALDGRPEDVRPKDDQTSGLATWRLFLSIAMVTVLCVAWLLFIENR